MHRSWFAIAILLEGFASTVVAEDAARPLTVFRVRVVLGEDRGQPLGSLFEARDADGRLVAGAGFSEVYNTRFRGNRRTLQFFVRPGDAAPRFTLERLPHPDLGTGVYLFDLDDKLYAWSSAAGDRVRRYDAASQAWVDELPPDCEPGLGSGDGVMRIGRNGLLAMRRNQVLYNRRPIVAPPFEGRYYNYYYAAGRLFFYHTRSAAREGATRILACAWSPGDPPLDVDRAVALDTRYTGETPFAWGQYQGHVLTVSNMGGVYVFDGQSWATLLEPDHTVSYQVYSMLNYYDRLLLAQYPSGELFAYDGRELKQLAGWPPRLAGVSSSAREAQTLAIYGGQLFVGVWPWAELWRYDRDRDTWHSLGRMFTHPEVTDRQVHPYEAEAEQLGLVMNHWGQRVTSMIPVTDGLLLGTSSKGTTAWRDEYSFLSDTQRREYGAVLRMTLPGNLAGQFEWKDTPTLFEFAVYRDRLVMRQDGRELGRAESVGSPEAFEGIEIRSGWGVFGAFGGHRIDLE